MKKQSFLASLFSSTIWKAVGHGSGLIKHIVIAAVIGLSTQLDIFYMAMALIGILILTWGEVFKVITLPRLVKAETQGDQHHFKKIASGIFTLAVGTSILLAVLLVSFRHEIAALAIGFDEAHQKSLAEAFILLVPAVVFSLPTGTFVAVLRAKRLFSRIYEADALRAITILGCIAIAPENPSVLLWSMSLAATAVFAYNAAFALQHIKLTTNPFDAEIIRPFRVAPALLVLYGTIAFLAIIDRIFASYLGEGAISALAYALMLASIIPALPGIDGSFMTVLAEKSNKIDRAKTVNDLFSLVIPLSAGATVFMALAGDDLIKLLLQRGAFGSADTNAVASALAAFAFAIAPLFVTTPLNQIFQLEKKIAFMVWRTIIGIFAGICLNYVAVFVLGWGVFGIAAATAITSWLIVLLGIFGLRRMGYDIATLRHLKWIAWSAGFMAIAWIILVRLPDWGEFINIVLAAGIIGGALAVAGLLWRGHERELLRQVMLRIIN